MPRDGTPDIRVTGLRKSYGDVVAVDAIDLEVAPGEFFTMLGPSGSGKTTTLRMRRSFAGSSERRGSGIYAVGTLPAARRRGVGTALTWALQNVMRAGVRRSAKERPRSGRQGS